LAIRALRTAKRSGRRRPRRALGSRQRLVQPAQHQPALRPARRGPGPTATRPLTAVPSAAVSDTASPSCTLHAIPHSPSPARRQTGREVIEPKIPFQPKIPFRLFLKAGLGPNYTVPANLHTQSKVLGVVRRGKVHPRSRSSHTVPECAPSEQRQRDENNLPKRPNAGLSFTPFCRLFHRYCGPVTAICTS
jgi:hypothetical protein